MLLADLLLTLLTEGAKLVATGAIQQTGVDAYQYLKDRLTGKHGVQSLGLLEKAKDNPAFEAAIRAELDTPAVQGDSDLLQAALILREALENLPEATRAQYAIDTTRIHSGGRLLLDAIEGIKAEEIISTDDMVIRNVTSPGK